MAEAGAKRFQSVPAWKVEGTRTFGANPIWKAFWFTLLLVAGIEFSDSVPIVEGDALLDFLKRANDSNKRINWDQYLPSPCDSWLGVTCREGYIISLTLPSMGFSGTLSPQIGKLKFLENLQLQDNDLHGQLPDVIGDLVNLQILNLANNRFTGPIPKTWANLSNLKYMDLSSNDASGRIPTQLFSVPQFNFTGTHLACGSGFEQPCVSSPSLHASTGRPRITVLAISSSCAVLLVVAVGLFFGYRYHQVRRLEHELFFDVAGEDDHKIPFKQVRRFSLRELQLATKDFSESNVIGAGGFGKVYKGLLPDNTKVAVKRLSNCYSPGGEAAFQREVELISVAVHKNLLKLIGFCTTSSERILVYPFMENLSVAYRLREMKPGEKGLDWPTRKRVALGAAHGLEYLHEHCNPKIIHRDLKAANILLDDKFEAVLGDFGLAMMVDTKLTHVTTQVRGTMGHIAPEYLSTGKSSEKTDVFGFGITLLELVTGQRAIDFARLEEEEDVLLLDHIKKLLRENRVEDIVDGNLESYDPKEVETIIQVALLCTQSSPENRPGMAEVVKMLDGAGVAERWEEWEQIEQARNQEFSLISHSFVWGEESSVDQVAIQLSTAR